MQKQLRPYQSNAIKAVKDNLSKGCDKALLVLATGLGKTVTAVKTADDFKRTLFIVDSEELLEQAALSFLREKFDTAFSDNVAKMGFLNYVKGDGLFAMSDFKMGAIKADVFQPNGNVVVASAQTLYKRLDRLDPEMFDLVIVDEAHCLPKGALIDNVPIEQIKKGDVVRSFNHSTGISEYKKVTNCYKGLAENDLIEIFLENGKSFLCTDNHPIYTLEYGYIKAKSVCFKQMGCLSLMHEEKNTRKNDRKLSCLQKTNGFRHKIKNSNIFKIWKNLLLFGMQERKLEGFSNSVYGSMQNMPKRGFVCNQGRKGEISLRNTLLQQGMFQNKKAERYGSVKRHGRQRKDVQKNEREQSNEKHGNSSKNDKFTKGKNIFSARREWRTDKTSNNVASSNRPSNGARYSNNAGKTFVSKCANVLQSRLSRTLSKACYRGRRENSQAEKMEVSGQKENGNIEFFRVAGYKVYKRGSREFYEKMCEEDYVYNIEVEGNNNYFVNNVLVHNCYMANTYFKGVSFFTPKLRLGLTATPHRQDNLPLGDLFDKIIYEYNIADGIKDGYLVELDAIRVKTNVSLDKVRTTAGELNQKDLSNEINTLARNNQIVDSYLKYAKGRKTITFCCDIQHCMDLADVFIERGIKATAVSSDEERTGDRSQKIRDFKAGKYDVVFNTNILTKGFDYPEVSCIIAAAPTKSLTRYMQAIGRGTRILPGVIDGLETAAERWSAIKKSDKKDCIIIDIVDNTNRHNIINAWNLDKEKEPEDRVFTTQEKKEKLLAARIAKLEHTREEDERVKLLPLPKIKMNKSIRMVEPATEAQLKAIQAWGYDIENNHYTKGMINEIFMQQSASEKQIGFLKWKGFDVSKGVSKAQAAAAFKMLEEKGLK